MSFKMAECNCDHTISKCVTLPGDSERESVLGRSSSCPWFIVSLLLLSQALRGSQTTCYRALNRAVAWRDAGRVRRSPLTAPTEPTLTKLTLWQTSCFTFQGKTWYEEKLDVHWSKYECWYWKSAFFLQEPFNVFTFCYYLSISCSSLSVAASAIQILWLCTRDSPGCSM